MGCVTLSGSTTVIAGFRFSSHTKTGNRCNHLRSDVMTLNMKSTIPLRKTHFKPSKLSRILLASTQHNPKTDSDEGSVEDLRVPNHWLDPLKASEESEWLRVTLHKWLDDEYCPEETNIKISEVASHSLYKSLMGKKSDLGEILLEMVQELSTISYQESFHGAFSSANAAVNLIIQRIQQD